MHGYALGTKHAVFSAGFDKGEHISFYRRQKIQRTFVLEHNNVTVSLVSALKNKRSKLVLCKNTTINAFAASTIFETIITVAFLFFCSWVISGFKFKLPLQFFFIIICL